MTNAIKSFGSHGDSVRWQDYEELVKDIYLALGKANGVTIDCWGSSCTVEGPPGTFSQIDVLTKHSDGVHRYRTAISCKYWDKKVGIPVVREFAQIIQDANLNKGVIVSKMGFTRPAKTLAASKNIGLVELRKPLDRDWEGYIREIHIELIIDQTRIDDVKFRLTASEAELGENGYRGGTLYWPLLPDQILIQSPGQEAKSFQTLINQERTKHPERENHDIEFPEGSTLEVPDSPDWPANGYLITGISFCVRFNAPVKQDIVVKADDHIYMIMESLFDGRRFTIKKDGEIIENTPWEDPIDDPALSPM